MKNDFESMNLAIFEKAVHILVSLRMSLFSEKMLISNRCISGFMSNLIKKSWTVSNLGVKPQTHEEVVECFFVSDVTTQKWKGLVPYYCTRVDFTSN